MTTDDLTYDNLASKLVEAVPTLRSAYEKEMAWWGKDKAGPVNIFDTIVTPRLMKLLSENPASTELKAIFNFLELMTKHPNKDVSNIVGAAVCEELCADEAALQRATKLMGPGTKRICDRFLKD